MLDAAKTKAFIILLNEYIYIDNIMIETNNQINKIKENKMKQNKM